jgi:hypothetical protein
MPARNYAKEAVLPYVDDALGLLASMAVKATLLGQSAVGRRDRYDAQRVAEVADLIERTQNVLQELRATL